jgi:methionine-rich copper-binding protein CopC
MSIRRAVVPCSFALAVLAAVASAPAFAHAKLRSSDPQPGSTLEHAPKHVRLTFNEALEPAFSKITLTGPAGNPIVVGATTVDAAEPAAMSVTVPPLMAGEYHVRWSAMTHDGHKVKGEVAFKVK